MQQCSRRGWPGALKKTAECALARQSREIWKKIAFFRLPATRRAVNIRPRCRHRQSEKRCVRSSVG
ncbi:hypothetical protein C1N62_09350 [Nissabacter sp. SGAir0207]|nr:hypothetical protein C1N62_09350 [Nissabacter sp. SGAir0207]